jgi:hypothetical protein
MIRWIENGWHYWKIKKGFFRNNGSVIEKQNTDGEWVFHDNIVKEKDGKNS